jgi:hypothetical protein
MGADHLASRPGNLARPPFRKPETGFEVLAAAHLVAPAPNHAMWSFAMVGFKVWRSAGGTQGKPSECI